MKSELAVKADPDAELIAAIRRLLRGYQDSDDCAQCDNDRLACSNAFLELIEFPLQAQERIEGLLMKLAKENE